MKKPMKMKKAAPAKMGHKKSPAKKSTKGLEALAAANNMKLTPMQMKKAGVKMKTAAMKLKKESAMKLKKSGMMMKKAAGMKMKKK